MRLRFTIRALLWLTLVIFLVVAWQLRSARVTAERNDLRAKAVELEAENSKATSELQTLSVEHEKMKAELEKLALEYVDMRRTFSDLSQEWERRIRSGMHFYPPKKSEDRKGSL